MKVLLLSAYDAQSHRYWHQSLVKQFPEYEWTVLTLPGRYFSWRMRGNSLSFAFSQREQLKQSYDLVIATSMTDLSALRGMVPELSQIPTLVYFHENQFAYPSSGREFQSVEPKVLNLYTALSADKVLFNSEFNRCSFLDGVGALLKKLPDQVPEGIVEHLEQNSAVLPVPLDQINTPEQVEVSWQEYQHLKVGKRPLLICWSARWEFDKGPDRLLAIIEKLEQSGQEYRLAILGESFRNSPKEFSQIKERFNHRVDQYGYAETREEYLAWLAAADIVLSTAMHEFQGLSVLEAVALGCLPVLPARQVYPELFPAEYLYPSYDKDINREAEAAVALMVKLADQLKSEEVLAPSIYHLNWQNMKQRYQDEFNQLLRLSD